MNQTKELVELSDGSDAGIRAIWPKLYSIQQEVHLNHALANGDLNQSVFRRECLFLGHISN